MKDHMTILIVDDEAEIRSSLSEILEEEGYRVVCAQSVAEAREASAAVDCAVVDIKLGADNGIDLLRFFRSARPTMPVIMISGHGTVQLTAEAFKLGAHDFLEKPLRLVSIRACLRNATESVRLRRRVAEQERERFRLPVYQSECMATLFGQVKKLAAISDPVMILGPSGSGKELVARSLHFDGPRACGAFVATNAASLPVSLAEDELFGHEKGAFTGASERRAGCLEQAHGGTLFLDEIGDMDPQVQAKLLRVIETGIFTRLGSTRQIQVNVRVIAATHKELDIPDKRATFRHDLWYRLSAFVLRVPPLSDRPEDIPLLAETFLHSACIEIGVTRRFTPAAIDALKAHPWPGNVRELRHAVTRAAVFAAGEEIGTDEIEQSTRSKHSAARPSTVIEEYLTMDFRSARDRFDREYLSALLGRHDGNITAAAASAGMAQSNLSRKLKELGLRTAG